MDERCSLFFERSSVETLQGKLDMKLADARGRLCRSKRGADWQVQRVVTKLLLSVMNLVQTAVENSVVIMYAMCLIGECVLLFLFSVTDLEFQIQSELGMFLLVWNILFVNAVFRIHFVEM